MTLAQTKELGGRAIYPTRSDPVTAQAVPLGRLSKEAGYRERCNGSGPDGALVPLQQAGAPEGWKNLAAGNTLQMSDE